MTLTKPGTLWLYGLGEWGPSALETFFRINLLIYCTDVLLIAPGAAGLMVAVGVIWDAITDPWIGKLSDSSLSRFGRRIPFMVLGAITLPISASLMFFVPQSSTSIYSIGFLYLLSNTSLTLINVPHSALGGDISKQDSIRQKIYAWRYLFTIVGLLSGIAIPGLLLEQDQRVQSYQAAAVIIGSIILLGTLICSWFFRDPKLQGQPQTPQRGIAQFLKLRSNHAFLILVVAYLAATIGQAINSATALYYYRYRLQLEESQTQGVLIVFTLVISLSIVIWQKLAERYDLRYLLFGSIFSLGLIGSIVYPMFPVSEVWPAYSMAVVGGILVGSIFLMDVALANVVDAGDEPDSYGRYFGFWKLSAKVSRALAIGLAGLLLEAIGFESGTKPDAETRSYLGFIFGPGVGVFFMLGAALMLKFPSTKEANKVGKGS
ncbi:MFS transporter [Pseudobacteriovorax antillogorgiicola]|uniref:Glycoside/pentoside/hexuronide:cation symporter, GPH family n=1 Tax=Pseudobacteriovorax antillogorgiicola TaxID=1513793 RepID=A0A1Y6CBN2_9BACT|nr:MFS transporter [Pseudobacteriovorax antillogorgiicola]TCS48994.1 GPH family glycoside/pentoside/hexuronide:cation symporter [Pseudobacteriovorax antillogorgiicola]SMF53352.1 glycoside/pentoside/hexuronide:cation symporter, GPH family [Pseudobacteriovorax antillogorgiicola]